MNDKMTNPESGASVHTPATGLPSEPPGANPVADALESLTELLAHSDAGSADEGSVSEVPAVELPLAHKDALTGLPNRMCFMECLHRAVESNRSDGPMLALLFFDLDGFKFVNDSLGHQAGDELLIEVGHRLNRVLVEGERLFRLAGDEFVIMADRLERLNYLPKLATRVLDEFQTPFIVTNEKAFVGASIGIAIRNDHGQTAEQLLHQADAAMYQSKRNGRRCYSFYNVDLDQEHRKLFKLRADIRDAIDGDEFVVHYQPKFDLKTNRVCGVEALVRWFRDGQQHCEPELFLGEAEKCGLIIPICQQVFRRVARDIAVWQEAGHQALPVSVNVSASHFRFGDLQDDLASAFLFSGIAPGLIEVELKEDALLHDVKQSVQKIQSLQRMGISVTVDDLGTGQASIAYLKKIPVDAVKVDQSFVEGVDDGEFESAVVEAMIRVAHTRNLRVVAEGVESEGRLEKLRALGCDQVQGFWCGRPCSPEDFAAQFLGSDVTLGSHSSST